MRSILLPGYTVPGCMDVQSACNQSFSKIIANQTWMKTWKIWQSTMNLDEGVNCVHSISGNSSIASTAGTITPRPWLRESAKPTKVAKTPTVTAQHTWPAYIMRRHVEIPGFGSLTCDDTSLGIQVSIKVLTSTGQVEPVKDPKRRSAWQESLFIIRECLCFPNGICLCR